MQLNRISLYLKTLRYLKPSQLYHRVSLSWRKPVQLAVPKVTLRDQPFDWAQPIERKSSMPSPNTFSFLNLTKDFEVIGWDGGGMERLWLYNLHYFDDLNAEDAKDRTSSHRALIENWINQNKSLDGIGWEPYPTSLRIVNWIKWALSGNSLDQEWLESVAIQTEWLSKRLEFHLLGNHLFANAKALLFSAVFFDGEQTHSWWETGAKLIARELDEQILGDGGHFERSPMYHCIVLEDLLDLYNLCRAYEQVMPGMSDLSQKLLSKITEMVEWLRAMMHPDGDISFFNDSALGNAPKPAFIFTYARKLGLSVSKQLLKQSRDLEQTGYIRLANDHAIALIDAAPIGPDYIPGHAHADTLSFELSVRGRRILVNGGTSTYENTPQRQKERSTKSHNTVEINGRNSSDVWDAFRVAHRAKPLARVCDLGEKSSTVSCSHDGYSSFGRRVHHHRTWDFQRGKIQIVDRIEGRNTVGMARFHFHPSIQLKQKSESSWQVEDHDHEILFEVIEGFGMVEPSTHSPAFGKIVESQCLCVSLSCGASSVCITWNTTPC